MKKAKSLSEIFTDVIKKRNPFSKGFLPFALAILAGAFLVIGVPFSKYIKEKNQMKELEKKVKNTRIVKGVIIQREEKNILVEGDFGKQTYQFFPYEIIKIEEIKKKEHRKFISFVPTNYLEGDTIEVRYSPDTLLSPTDMKNYYQLFRYPEIEKCFTDEIKVDGVLVPSR